LDLDVKDFVCEQIDAQDAKPDVEMLKIDAQDAKSDIEMLKKVLENLALKKRIQQVLQRSNPN